MQTCADYLQGGPRLLTDFNIWWLLLLLTAKLEFKTYCLKAQFGIWNCKYKKSAFEDFVNIFKLVKNPTDFQLLERRIGASLYIGFQYSYENTSNPPPHADLLELNQLEKGNFSNTELYIQFQRRSHITMKYRLSTRNNVSIRMMMCVAVE